MINNEEQNKVTIGNFAMQSLPVDYQLTKHINNFIIQDKNSIKFIKTYLNDINTFSKSTFHKNIKNVVDYYGVEVVQNWFSSIYGWEFTVIKKVG